MNKQRAWLIHCRSAPFRNYYRLQTQSRHFSSLATPGRILKHRDPVKPSIPSHQYADHLHYRVHLSAGESSAPVYQRRARSIYPPSCASSASCNMSL